MQLRTARDVGLALRDRRRQLKLDQDNLAKQIGVSRKWLIDVEKGKPGAELGLILRAFTALGLSLTLGDFGTNPTATDIDRVIERARDPS
jgi:HTH-type transcriptional regulator/antitoxin HipB